MGDCIVDDVVGDGDGGSLGGGVLFFGVERSFGLSYFIIEGSCGFEVGGICCCCCF